MRFLQPTLPPYDPAKLSALPFAERARLICQAWAVQGHGAPVASFVFYAVKIAIYVAVWVALCALTPGLGGPATIGEWWLSPLAFQKAILWSMLFEGLGLGCGSGPLTGRYVPPFGGFLYFLRPGTTKLAPWPRLPLVGGVTRSWLDVGLYALLILSLARALLAPELTPAHLWPIVVVVPLLSLCDRMQFLVFRSEHYWTVTTCFALSAQGWVAPTKAVWLALWFWAGFSKLNHHFPNVVCVMTSNSPYMRFPWLRKRMYRSHPEDLRPSRLAVWVAHAGTVLELAVPVLMVLAPEGQVPVAGLVAMVLLHGFIFSNFPMGVPLEWNVMMVYGGLVLFYGYPAVSVLEIQGPLVVGLLAIMLVALPLLGNLFPERVSFLLSMRYYAGNWACGVWLMRADALRRFSALKVSVPAVDRQLARIYDPATVAGMLSRGLGFRLMHLHGRALVLLMPRAAPHAERYLSVDGEGMAGRVLGWNFGDGHLHGDALLRAVQAQCHFAPGEVLGIFVESQPLGRGTLAYRIVDASRGLIEAGEVSVRTLRDMQPWGVTDSPAA